MACFVGLGWKLNKFGRWTLILLLLQVTIRIFASWEFINS